MIGDLLSAFVSWAKDVIEAVGYPGLAFLITLENVFPPIPSEGVLPMAGFLAGEGKMNIFLAILAASVGSVVGALVLYWFGHWFGEDRVRALVRRWGKWFGVSEKDVDKADDWFDRYGGAAVMICRVVPIVRSLISIPAGLRRMPIGMFMLYTFAGSAVWNTVLISAGWFLGDNWERVAHYVDYFEYVAIVGVLLVAAWWVWNRMIKRRVPTA